MNSNDLRERHKPTPSEPDERPKLQVRIEVPGPVAARQRLQQQRERILQFQRRWERIKADLPPQLSRKHIGMISIGGVIGTGLFLGFAVSPVLTTVNPQDAIRNGGPVGAFLGYAVVGTVVYCLCVSIGEMIAFLPNVGGVVGLADLYVDPALGFSLGWAAWYNWSVVLPTEITAAAVVIGFWKKNMEIVAPAVSAIFLVIATTVNCFPSRVYGQMEYFLSCIKVLTIVLIVLLGLLVDLGASHEGVIGFRNWKNQPFGDNYLGFEGAKGQFLGFYTVIKQASFSFFGSEVPGIAAGEVIDATRNVPRALRKVWIRITLFYVGGILVSGLLVPANDDRLALGDRGDKTGRSSPFVIAFSRAGWTVLPHVVNAAILLSAWSAAASDIYISSRFLFFLSRRGHAPTFLAHLFRYPRARTVRSTQSDSDSNADADSDSDGDIAEVGREAALSDEEIAGEQVLPSSQPTYVMPLASVLVSASVGLLTFLSYGTGSASTVFNWLANVASIASLQSWVGMLFTYIRWYQGTIHYERKWKGDDSPEGREAMAQIETIKRNRNWGQPYLAWYALASCVLVLFTNGWAVFVNNGWRIADTHEASPLDRDVVSQFLSAYVPLPFFLLLTFGYKLIKQTEMIPLEKMTFYQGQLPTFNPEDNEPKGRLEKLLAWLLLI